jgi:hypothetical protein
MTSRSAGRAVAPRQQLGHAGVVVQVEEPAGLAVAVVAVDEDGARTVARQRLGQAHRGLGRRPHRRSRPTSMLRSGVGGLGQAHPAATRRSPSGSFISP